MRTISPRGLAAAALGLVVLAGAACGSSTPSAEEDKKRAERMVLTLADLPGFVVDPEEDDGKVSDLNECVNGNPTWTEDPKPRGFSSPDFSKDDGNVVVSSGAVLTVEVSEAQKAMADMREALASECLREGLKASVLDGADSGVSVRSVQTTPQPGPTYGDESVASRTVMQISAPGERLTMNVDFVFLRSGRMLAGVFTLQIGSPFPDAERNRLAALVESRMTGKPVDDEKAAPASTAAPATTDAPATTTAVSGRSTWTRYSDPSGVQLEHAPAWTVRPGAAGPLAVIMDPATGVPFRRNVNIAQQTRNVPVTLEEITDLNLQEVQQLEGFSRITGGATTLSGTPAHRLSYRATLEGQEMRFLSVWTVRDNKVWTVTYTSDPDRFIAGMGDVERLLASIKLPSAS